MCVGVVLDIFQYVQKFITFFRKLLCELTCLEGVYLMGIFFAMLPGSSSLYRFHSLMWFYFHGFMKFILWLPRQRLTQIILKLKRNFRSLRFPTLALHAPAFISTSIHSFTVVTMKRKEETFCALLKFLLTYIVSNYRPEASSIAQE